MSTPVRFRIWNATNSQRRLVLFQQDASAVSVSPSRPPLSFVLAVRTLSPTSYWDYALPGGALQVAGMIRSTSTSGESTSNIENAIYGDCWEIHQQSGGPLTLKRSSNNGPEGAIKVVNLVDAGLGPRVAALYRGGDPVLGVELEPGNDACFSLQLALYVAEVEDKDYSARQLLRPETVARAMSIPYASFQSVDTHVARLASDASGRLSLMVERTVREEARAPQSFERA